MRNTHCRTLIMARKLKKKKSGKRETHMVGTGIWRETLKKLKNEKINFNTMKMARNTPKC